MGKSLEQSVARFQRSLDSLENQLVFDSFPENIRSRIVHILLGEIEESSPDIIDKIKKIDDKERYGFITREFIKHHCPAGRFPKGKGVRSLDKWIREEFAKILSEEILL